MTDKSRADELEDLDLMHVRYRAIRIIRELEDGVSSMGNALRLEKDRRMLAESVAHELVDAKTRLTKERDDARRKCLEHMSDAGKREAAYELGWRGLYDKVEE